MKETINYLNCLIFLLAAVFLSSCGNDHSVKTLEYHGATTELIKMVEQNPGLKNMLSASIAKAKEINPDRNTNPVQNLDEYYEFVSWAETAMPWALLKKADYPEIYDNTQQSLGYFYFLIEQPLAGLDGQGLFHNTLQYAEPFASWLVSFNKSWGRFLDSEDSWNEKYYQMVLKAPAFGLQNGWYEDPANWKTFNQFFARYLRSPAVRPIAAPDDNAVVASSADSQPMGVWAIDSSSNIIAPEGVAVKSATLRSIVKLIGEDSPYKDAFAGGTFTHSFLGIGDYHHYHFPLSGTIKEVRIIQGINPSGGSLSWDAKNNRYAFDPSAGVGWQMLETRGCVILQTERYGLVALLPIGMATVGSVNFEEHIKPGVEVRKGDMMGHFAFGGSDFIMLFQDRVNFTLEAPRQEGRDAYQHLLMGERLGHLTAR